jgi:hypothetical protein
MGADFREARADANHLRDKRDKRKVELSGRISRDSNEEIATYGKQIVGILKEADSGVAVHQVWRKHGMSSATAA